MALRLIEYIASSLDYILDAIANRSLCQTLRKIILLSSPGRHSLLAHAAIINLVFTDFQALSVGKAGLNHRCEWDQRPELTIFTVILTIAVNLVNDHVAAYLAP